MHFEYRPPTAEDIAYVAEHMRPLDQLEVHASSGSGPLESLAASVRASTLCFTCVVDGKPAVIFGFTYTGGMAAEVWLLGTTAMDRISHASILIREGRRITDEWADKFGLLHNRVHDDNAPSKRWLKAIGFSFGKPRPYGPHGAPFRYFYKEGGDGV